MKELDLIQIGRKKHRIYGVVEAFLDKKSGCEFYMIHQCPGCGCNNVLVKGQYLKMCVDCIDLRAAFNTGMKHIQNYNDHHINIAPDKDYEKFEEIVQEYQRRRNAGLYVPDKFDQAVYMIKYWRRFKGCPVSSVKV